MKPKLFVNGVQKVIGDEVDIFGETGIVIAISSENKEVDLYDGKEGWIVSSESIRNDKDKFVVDGNQIHITSE